MQNMEYFSIFLFVVFVTHSEDLIHYPQYLFFHFLSFQQLKDEIAEVTAEMENMDVSEEK